MSPVAQIASPDAIRVRGTFRETECVESPPHPKPSLRYGFDLSPQAGRGEEARRPCLSPLSGRGRGASPDARRVRGSRRESECVESPPHPKPSLRYGFDLSPQAGRGEE